MACVLRPVRLPVFFESAAATSTDAGISSRQSSRNRQNSSLVKTVSKALLFCYSFWPCQTLPVTAVMFYSPVILESVTGNFNPLLQVALIYMGFLAGTLLMLKFGDWLPTRWVPVGTFAAMTAWLGRHCLRSVCRHAWHLLRTLCPSIRNAVNVGLFAPNQLFREYLDFCVQGGFQGGNQSRLSFVYRGLKINDQRLRGTLSRRQKCAKRHAEGSIIPCIIPSRW